MNIYMSVVFLKFSFSYVVDFPLKLDAHLFDNEIGRISANKLELLYIEILEYLESCYGMKISSDFPRFERFSDIVI